MNEESTILIYGLGNEGLAWLGLASIASRVIGYPGEVRGYNRSSMKVEPLKAAAARHAKIGGNTYDESSGLCYIEFQQERGDEIFRQEVFGNGRYKGVEELIQATDGGVKVGCTSHIVTDDFETAMLGKDKTHRLPDYVVVCTVANAHAPFAKMQADLFNSNPNLLKNHEGKINYVLSPGRFLGAWEAHLAFYASLDDSLQDIAKEKIVWAESGTSPYASRISTSDPTKVTVVGGKAWNPIAAIPESETHNVATGIRKINPIYVEVKRDKGREMDVRYTSQTSTIAIPFHVLMTTMGAPLMYHKQLDYYADLPAIPLIAAALEVVDKERVEALKSLFGTNAWSGLEIMKRMYPLAEGDDIALAMINNPAYQGISAPRSLTDLGGKLIRYLSEDGPFTTDPLVDAVDKDIVPFITSILGTAHNTSIMLTGKPLIGTGRTAESLGLEGRTQDEIKSMLKTGIIPEELLALWRSK